MGVCVGCRYVDSNGQVQYNNFVPANLVTGGASEVFVRVADDPNTCTKSKELSVSARSTAEQTALVMQALSA
jgi:hypothetical protein